MILQEVYGHLMTIYKASLAEFDDQDPEGEHVPGKASKEKTEQVSTINNFFYLHHRRRWGKIRFAPAKLFFGLVLCLRLRRKTNHQATRDLSCFLNNLYNCK